MSEKIVVLGAGGHAKVILDILLKNKEYDICGIIDRDDKEDKQILNVPIIGNDSILPILCERGIRMAIVAVGNNAMRRELSARLISCGYELISAISVDAVISQFAHIGKGVAVMPGAIINAGATIGDGAIINTNASVDHDCNIGNFSHIAPGSAISGGSTVGENSFLGTGSRVIDGITIGDNVMLGAGAVAIRDIPKNCTAVGVPAAII